MDEPKTPAPQVVLVTWRIASAPTCDVLYAAVRQYPAPAAGEWIDLWSLAPDPATCRGLTARLDAAVPVPPDPVMRVVRVRIEEIETPAKVEPDARRLS